MTLLWFAPTPLFVRPRAPRAQAPRPHAPRPHAPRPPRRGRLLRAFIAAAGLLLAGGYVSAQSPADNANATRTYFSANGLLNRGLYDLAIAEYRSFLRQFPDHEKADIARYGLGVSLFRLDRHADAVEAIAPLQALGQFTYAAEVSTILGQCHLALSQYDQAAQRFQNVLDNNIDHALADDAAALQAEAWHYAGQHARVADPCRLLVSRWPESPLRERAELFWGLAEMTQGNYSASAERFGSLLESFPDGSHADQAHLLHAQSLHRANAPRRAIEQYRRVLKQAHDTYLPEALYGLSLLLYQEKQAKTAGPMLDEMLERFPESTLAAPARILRGRVWFDDGNLDKAREQFDKVSRRDPEYGDDAAYWNAKCELRADKPQRSATRLAEAIERFPRSELLPEMMYDRAVALTRFDQNDAAIAQLEAFRQRFPKNALAPDALHLAAATEHQRRGYDSSLSACRTFLSDHPDHALAPAMSFMAAENAFLSQRYKQAAGDYRSFLERYPADVQASAATYRLGMSLYQMGDYENAEPLLTKSAAKRKKSAMFRPALLAIGDLHFQAGRWSSAETYFVDFLEFGLDQPSADDALFKLGLSHHRQDDAEAAIAAFDRLIAEFPESHQPQVIFERGQALMTLDRLAEAKRVFRHIAKTNPGSRFAMHASNHLGTIAINERDYEAAARYFERVTNQDNADAGIKATALAQQGASHFAAGAFDDAESAFERLLKQYPDSAHAPRATAQLAIAHARRDNHAAAINVIATMGPRMKDSLDSELRASLAYEKAWCLRALERPEQAMEAYDDLIRESDGSDLANHGLLELAELESGSGAHDRAEAHLDRLLARPDVSDEVRGQAMYRRGVCAYENDRHREAAQRLAEFLEEYPSNDLANSAHLIAGESFFKAGSHQRAVVHLKHITSGDTSAESYGPALLRLGECHAALQNWPESEVAFARYLKRFAATDLAYQAQFGVGWARENLGKHDAAIAAYRKVVDGHDGPTSARAQFQVGECLYADREYEAAAREFLKVDILYSYPEWSAAALYEAARCFRELGDPVQARNLFKQVARDHGGSEWARLATERLEELSRSGLPGH